MNEASANLPALDPVTPPPQGEGWPAGPKIDEGWSRNKILFLIVLAVIVHIALIFAFGTKKQFIPRAVTNVPRLQLANRADELLELDNPALFALPNPRDFSSEVWQRPPPVPNPSYRYTEEPRWLKQPAQESLGATFTRFMQTNQFGNFALNFKPPPQFAEPVSPITLGLPQETTLEIFGALAQRPLLVEPALPSLDWNDIIAPSKVQVTVDQTGNVISAVLLPSDNPLEAAGRSAKGDTNALTLVRSLKFAPAPQLVLGEIIFHWHTLPLPATNSASDNLETPP